MKNQKGITLVALIITIVVIMILVAVSVTVALQSGLFSATSKAASDTRAAAEKENELAAGKVTVEGTEYNSIQEYIDTLGGSTGSGSGEMITFTFFHESYTVEEGTTWGEFVAYFNSLSTPAEPGCGQTGCGWTRGRWFDGTAFYYNGCECGYEFNNFCYGYVCYYGLLSDGEPGEEGAIYVSLTDEIVDGREYDAN